MKKLLILLSILFAFIGCKKNEPIIISGILIQGNVTSNLYFDNDNEHNIKYVFTSESDIQLLRNYTNKHLTIETEYNSNYYIKVFGEKGVALFNVTIIEISESTRPIYIPREPYIDPNQWIDYPQ